MLALRKQPNGSSRTCWDASISSSVFATRVITSKTLKYVEYSRIQIKNMHMFLKHSTLPTALFLIFRSETFMSCYLGSTEPMLGWFCVWTSQWWEWSSVFGYNLRPQIWKKMPRRLAKRLSAGFQAKESQPQVRSLFYICKTDIVYGCQRTILFLCVGWSLVWEVHEMAEGV